MNKEDKIKYLKKELDFELSEESFINLEIWEELFKKYNSHTNLMSKNDVEILFKKHVIDSLSILKWDEFLKMDKILDVGTGGGFPSVILAICFPEKTIIANDSRIKKINFITEIKEKLNLKNLEILYARIEENEPLNVDLVVSRAVGKMLDVYELSKKHLKKDGKFLIYKSRLINEEINYFKNKYKNSEFQIIPYKLPLKESFERNLIILNPNSVK